MRDTPDAQAVWARLWDGPTRLVHWALVALIGFAWWSAETGHMDWHRPAGYAVVGLLVFRVLWGFLGSRSAKFASFVRGPAATLAYIRTLPARAHSDMPGHNPLGAWSVLAILATLAVQTVTGLFAVDVDGIESGPPPTASASTPAGCSPSGTTGASGRSRFWSSCTWRRSCSTCCTSAPTWSGR